MSNERQIIEEMARDICNLTVSCEECVMLAHKTGQSKEQYCKAMRYAERAYNAGYRKQSEGEWRDRGFAKIGNKRAPIVECSECHITFCDLINNHYFMYHHCPFCGAKMKGGAE